MKPNLKEKNLAVGQLQAIKGSGKRKQFAGTYTPDNVAKSKVIRISNNENTKKTLGGLSAGEKKTLWYAAGVAIVILVLFALAVKYKYIKL